MSAVLITLIIAASVIILAAMDNYYGLRKKELETKLRMAEMDRWKQNAPMRTARRKRERSF